MVANPLAGWPPVLVKPRRSWSSGLQPMPLVKAKTSISCPLQLVYSLLTHTWRLIAVIKCLWRLTSICAT